MGLYFGGVLSGSYTGLRNRWRFEVNRAFGKHSLTRRFKE